MKDINEKSMDFEKGANYGTGESYFYVTYAEYMDGTPLTDKELEELNADDDYMHQLAYDNAF
jgi:predicted porin